MPSGKGQSVPLKLGRASRRTSGRGTEPGAGSLREDTPAPGAGHAPRGAGDDGRLGSRQAARREAPTLHLQPIVVTLLVFFAFLSLSALLQLFFYWRDLATRQARNEFVRTWPSGPSSSP